MGCFVLSCRSKTIRYSAAYVSTLKGASCLIQASRETSNSLPTSVFGARERNAKALSSQG